MDEAAIADEAATAYEEAEQPHEHAEDKFHVVYRSHNLRQRKKSIASAVDERSMTRIDQCEWERNAPRHDQLHPARALAGAYVTSPEEEREFVVFKAYFWARSP